MSVAAHHNDWLNLVEVSGPFLALPVLMDALPAGLDKPERELTADLWRAFTEWSDEDHGGASDPAVHEAWVRYVLEHVLEFDADVLVREDDALDPWAVEVPEHDTWLTPDLLIRDPEDEEATARLLVTVVAPDVSVTEPPEMGWSASPAERMESLLNGVEARLGIVTNGDQWTLVHVAEGENTGFATWYASLWREEPLTFRAFITLLGMRRFFAVADNETLDALLDRSREDQKGVTTQLGKQVRRAIEILIQQIDRVDHDRDGRLLEGMTEERLYESAVTVMMRLIFLFYAEENDLLLLGDDFYDQNYAASTLREQLQATADESGEEILERFHDAWPRLLSTFRAVHTGVEHEQMRLPAYGGALFDPDRYPFLEGREPDTTWLDETADPLPIDNRTVLHLLNAIQTLEVKVPGGGRENRPLSFRALDVEQIGHVYETLLDHTAVRAEDWVFGLEGTKDKEPEVPLGELEARADDQKELVKYLKDETGRSAGALNKRVAAEEKAIYDRWGQRWMPAFQGDQVAAERATRWGLLVREDSAEHPVVVPPGRVYVTESERRRSSGTHYTPKSLTEEIVTHALEPLVYHGPADGKGRSDWELRSPDEILDLKVCDPACGSGAFLVQACRYLAERLVEAWNEHSALDGPDGHRLPVDPEERLIVARRYVADRCLYGVDINPLATEMAKLSLWLITLQKSRPFTFLDHAVRTGDSLLGVTDFTTLEAFGVSKGQTQLWSQSWAPQLKSAREARQELRSFSVVEPKDASHKRSLLGRAADELSDLFMVADAIAGMQLAAHGKTSRVSEGLRRDAGSMLERALTQGTSTSRAEARDWSQGLLDVDLPKGADTRTPFHWALEFPEVLDDVQGGFDAMIGNPPFVGGTKISGAMGGAYRAYLVSELSDGRAGGRTDYVAYFILRGASLANLKGNLGFVATSSVAEGDTREAGLASLLDSGWRLFRATRRDPWPGQAALQIAKIWLSRSPESPAYLDSKPVPRIDSYLRIAGRVEDPPSRLPSNSGLCFEGTKVYGKGFVVSSDVAESLFRESPSYHDVVRPYMSGEDVNSRTDRSPSRYVLYFESVEPDRAANEYPLAWEIAQTQVRPERVPSDPDAYANRYKKYPQMIEEWWRYWRPRSELYSRLERLDSSECIVLTRHTKHVMPEMVTHSGVVFSDALDIFASSDPRLFSFLCSSVHFWWAVRRGSSLGEGVRYTPSDVFETLPIPALSARLADLSERLAHARRALSEEFGMGLTETYNMVHDPEVELPAVRRLRDVHSEIDQVVVRECYGWSDLELALDFFDSEVGVRWGPDESTVAELMDRMLAENLRQVGQLGSSTGT